jgi:phage/plasmid-like protein (TIGR03299 family)
MAHNLTIMDGRASMAYIGATPWHGLGQVLTADAPIETWLVEAGMSYKICRSRVRFGANENPEVWDDRHVLFRNDTKAPFAVVSNRYQIVQPAEVLEFFRNLCDNLSLKLETAGTLKGGSVYWALARLPHNFALAGGDKVNGYVLLATSADGSLATTGMVTSVRVVCNNTLDAAMMGAKSAIKVRHSTEFKATKVQVEMGLLDRQWETFAGQCERLSSRKLTKREAAKILIAAMGDPEKSADDQPNARPMGEILRLFSGEAKGSTLASANGTAWGLVNAATEHFDHHAGRSPDTRLTSTWFGANATRKADIFSGALAFADGLPDLLQRPVSAK